MIEYKKKRRDFMSKSMVGSHAVWPHEDDPIFGLAKRAGEAKEKFGKEKVIDSTLGSLVDDDGNLICFDSVYDELKNLPNSEIAAYAQVAGQGDFLESVIEVLFKEYKPEGHIRAVATPGGTGAVRHGIWNYTEPGDTFIVGDWYWSPYQTMADEFERKLKIYPFFNEKGGYNVEAFKENFNSIIDSQKRVLTIFNTPANNPTGYSISDEEWDEILEIIKEKAKDKENKITILLDVAYIDYAGNDRRSFFKKFGNLPDNIFVMIAFSMSKGYTMYGMRSGAAIGISSNESIADEFYYSLSHANRSNWSNGVRGAMKVLTNLYRDKDKKAKYEAELESIRKLLVDRAKAFVDASKEVGLVTLPYRDGFFVTIPCENSKDVSEELIKDNLFAVPLKKGLRFAVCAVSKEKCAKSPALIKKALDKING